MDSGALYMAALLAGVLGAGHCIGMCGGITAALSLSFPKRILVSAPLRFLHLLAINSGRICGYGSIGALAGLIGEGSQLALNPEPALLFSKVLTAVVLFTLGIYYMGSTRLLLPLEKLGHRLWRQIQPLTLRIQPGSHLLASFATGYLWAFLPCGMVYGAAALALASSNMVIGAQIMLLFGLATLPTLLSAGFFASELEQLLRQTWVRRSAGALLIIAAVVLLTPK